MIDESDTTGAKNTRLLSDARAQSGPNDAFGMVFAVVLVAIVAVLGVLIVGSLAGFAVDSGTESGAVEYDPTPGEEEIISQNIDERPAFLSVKLTTENAVELSGNDTSYVELDDAGALDNGSWTVMASGELDEGYNQQATINLFAHDNESITIAYSDGEWVGTYIDGDQSAQVNLTANSPTEFQTLALRYDNSTNELTLVDGTRVSDSDTLDTESVDRPLQLNWPGRVDEFRFFPNAVGDAELQFLANNPVAGTAETQTARFMLDEGSGTTSEAYYSESTATLNDAEWGGGLADPGLEKDVDYSVSFGPLAVTTLSDGLADNSPVLYVEWDDGLGATLQAMISGFGSAIELVGILLIALVASAVIVVVSRFQ